MRMQQTHINSFFKRKETSATSEIQSISTNNLNNDDVNNDSEQKTKTVNSVNSSDFVDVNNVGKDTFVKFRPDKSFKFPKTTIGNRDCRCQHQWFKDFKWLHYDMERDCVLCFYCFTHEHQLTAEHNKEPAYEHDFEIGRRLLGTLKNMSKANAIPLLYHRKPLFQNVEIQKR